MRSFTNRLANLVFSAAILIAAALTPQAANAAKWFVDNALGDVPAAEKRVPANPKPVQLLFEFQRDGKPNPAATKQVKPWASDALKKSGVFSDVVEVPTADGAVMSIKFNNIVKKEEIDKAKKDGFKAGLGFGLFGGVVATDYYEVTMELVPANGGKPITTVVKHALHMKFGKKNVEIPGTQVKNVMEAVQIVVRQSLDRGVNNIVSDAAFPR
jgi:hypothetical protein